MSAGPASASGRITSDSSAAIAVASPSSARSGSNSRADTGRGAPLQPTTAFIPAIASVALTCAAPKRRRCRSDHHRPVGEGPEQFGEEPVGRRERARDDGHQPRAVHIRQGGAPVAVDDVVDVVAGEVDAVRLGQPDDHGGGRGGVPVQRGGLRLQLRAGVPADHGVDDVGLHSGVPRAARLGLVGVGVAAANAKSRL